MTQINTLKALFSLFSLVSWNTVNLGRLIGLNKCHEVRLVGVGENWCRMLVKCVLAVTGSEAKEACGTEQLCDGLEAGIEGGIHVVLIMLQQHSQEENWWFLLIDAHNTFNEEIYTSMMCAVCHKWSSGARFVFNWYRNWSKLVIRGSNRTYQFLYSKEGWPRYIHCWCWRMDWDPPFEG